jgi:hypothetical protein
MGKMMQDSDIHLQYIQSYTLDRPLVDWGLDHDSELALTQLSSTPSRPSRLLMPPPVSDDRFV